MDILTLNNALYEACNRLAGHSWLFDNLVSLACNNPLVKSALIGGCFLAAWHTPDDKDTLRRNRRILIMTLVASIVVLATTKLISTHVFVPRPFIQSQTVYHLQDHQLVQGEQLEYRVPLDDESQQRYRNLMNGEVLQNDLTAFPSDHASFYVTLAIGILLASRPLGLFALSWTLVVVLASRIVAGDHSPLDILAGSAIGVGVMWMLHAVLGRWLRPLTEPIVNWTLRHQAVATALVFIVVFEGVNTLQDVQPLIETGAALAKYFHLG